MGLGCNAAGVTGCRIIDSPRERLIAVLTNNFMPCNGRFPILIAVSSMFLIGSFASPFGTLLSTLVLTAVLAVGVGMTLLLSRLLSATLLRGVPSSFTLELPPYRRPQIGKVILRSLLDRTLFVLGRAVCVAAPAGLIIWLTANISIGDASVFARCAGFLDGFAKQLGMDGVILLAFLLGFPANEIVIPITLMGYLAAGTITDVADIQALRGILVDNGWTWLTAVNVMLFTLLHWPCSTTCLTIRKETGGWKWTLLSFLVPTVTGVTVCFLFTGIVRLISGVT